MDFLLQFVRRYLNGRHLAPEQFIEKASAADAEDFRCLGAGL